MAFDELSWQVARSDKHAKVHISENEERQQLHTVSVSVVLGLKGKFGAQGLLGCFCAWREEEKKPESTPQASLLPSKISFLS